MNLPPEQAAIRDRCFHPAGHFIAFPQADVDASIPERFEKIVRLHSGRIAIHTDAGTLTYEELNQSANRVARSLVEKLGPGNRPVVIFSDQNVSSVILALGIWKSGKILIGIEPSFPRERVLSTVHEAQAEAIVTTDPHLQAAKSIAESGSIPALSFDSWTTDQPADNLELLITSEMPAELRYSSGSTGTPKGIVRSHRRLLNSARSTINSAHLCPEDRVLALTRLRYGARDLLQCLLSGATLFPFDIEKETLAALARLLRAREITCYKSVPTTFRYLIGQLDDTWTFPSMRLIQLGGDLLYRSDIVAYKRHFPDDCILMNRLSAGETGNLCVFFIDKNTEVETAIVPVGYPVEGKTVLLLDEARRQVEVGEIGEIAVASRYLSSGYWNNLELTHEKFFDNDERGEERLYISGDLGRMLPDGCLLYVGRKDDQVKIRGAKVETGQIEAVLSEHPEIRQSAVVAYERPDGDKYLTAYLVCRSHPAPIVSEIRDYLRTKMPDYMIPSVFMFMDSIPLTNGKTDRKLLPKPDDKRPALATPFALPANDVEKALAAIWEEVLDVRPIGRHDGFFDLGGHSLSASRVVSRVIERFQVDIPLQSLLESPTIADMARVITASQDKMLDEQSLTKLLDELDEISEE